MEPADRLVTLIAMAAGGGASLPPPSFPTVSWSATSLGFMAAARSEALSITASLPEIQTAWMVAGQPLVLIRSSISQCLTTACCPTTRQDEMVAVHSHAP